MLKFVSGAVLGVVVGSGAVVVLALRSKDIQYVVTDKLIRRLIWGDDPNQPRRGWAIPDQPRTDYRTR